MKFKLLALFLAISPMTAFAADIASVNFKALQDDISNYDASETGAIIYAKAQVDDVTTIVKQKIIDLGKKK